MLDPRGYALNDPVVREGDKREIVAEYVAAHEVAEAVEQGKDVSSEDIETAMTAPARCTTICGRERRTVGPDTGAQSAQIRTQSLGIVDREGGGRFSPPGWGRGRGIRVVG